MSRIFSNTTVKEKLCVSKLGCATISSTGPTGPTGPIEPTKYSRLRILNNLLASRTIDPRIAKPRLGSATDPYGEIYLKSATLYIGDATISSTGTTLITNSIKTDFISLTGPNGNSIDLIVTNDGLQVTGVTGYCGIVGPIGDQGEIGLDGPEGDMGPDGDGGPIGYGGPTGDEGENGDQGATGDQGIIIGDVGPQGFTGPQGSAGQALFTGPTGPQGPTGIYSLTTETLLSNTTISPNIEVSFLGSDTYTLSTGTVNAFNKSLIDINNVNDISGDFNVESNTLNSIRLSSTGSNLNATWSSSLGKWVINSYQGATGGNGFKTFVIDHPVDDDKYLVHACLEGPEAGVYYRGIGEIKEGEECTEVELPDYLEDIASDFTVQITPIWNGEIRTLNFSEVIDNKFRVYGQSGKFFWQVNGLQGNIEIEPFKSTHELRGDGPYKWLL